MTLSCTLSCIVSLKEKEKEKENINNDLCKGDWSRAPGDSSVRL